MAINDKIIIDMSEAGFKTNPVLISSTNGTIKSTKEELEENTVDKNKYILKEILRNLAKIYNNIDEIYDKGNESEEWADFCANCVIFVILRFILFGDKIPIVDEKNFDLKDIDL